MGWVVVGLDRLLIKLAQAATGNGPTPISWLGPGVWSLPWVEWSQAVVVERFEELWRV